MTGPSEMPLTILPPLRDVRPKRSRIAPCYYGDVFSNDAVREAYADNAWRSGITWTYGTTSNGVAQRLLPRGLGVILSFPWEPWTPPGEFAKVLELRPDIGAIDFAGKPVPRRLCPTWALSHFDDWRPELAKLADGLLRDSTYRGVNWDLEEPVVDPPTFCTCERCLAAFAKEAGLSLKAELKPAELLGPHRDAWVAFRCRQNATMLGHLRELFKAAKPDVEVSLYSGYASRYTREHYGVDWPLLAQHLDLGIAGYGYDRANVAATREAMGAKPFLGGEMYYLSPHTDERVPPSGPAEWRNRLVRQYLGSGCRGVLIWWLPTMEGGAFYGTSEAAELIAGEEEFLDGAERVEGRFKVTGLPAGDWHAFRKGGETRVYLLNLKEQAVEATLTGPAGWAAGVRSRGNEGTSAAEGEVVAATLRPFGWLCLTADP
ncbi:MAG: hypothetical protein HYU66_24235 [Armatimonadetes bacterium]|nr:hypothetical protein [Armatimonadota bacterium]